MVKSLIDTFYIQHSQLENERNILEFHLRLIEPLNYFGTHY